MILIKSKNITQLYKKSLIQVNNLPDLQSDPKNYKDTSAVLTLDEYKNEEFIGIKDKRFYSKFNYERFVPGGNELMKMELTHYNNLFFSNKSLNNIILHLKENPYSKKAVLNFWKSEYKDETEIPCVVYLWFRNRNGYLDMDCHMRANDAFRLVLMDVHIMTSIHQYVASELKLKKGSYYHFVDSLHLYERDRENIDKIIVQLQNEK